MNKYRAELDFISGKIKECYDQIISCERVEILDKSTYDEVTSVDFEIEKSLISHIKQYDPEAHILSEEYNFDSRETERTWIIDPIDGTCNFSHSLHTYGIQCALYAEGEVQLAAIYFPCYGEMFTAIRGEGAWLNGEALSKANRSVNRSLVSFGDFMHADEKLFELEHRIMRRVSARVERIRMYGAASMDFAYCACGRLDGNFTFVRNSWDIAPGILLCQQAGLLVTDAYGKPYTSGSDTVAVFATNELRKACCED